MVIDGIYYPNISCRECKGRHPKWITCEGAVEQSKLRLRTKTASLPSPTDGIVVASKLTGTHLRYLVRIITTGHVVAAFEHQLDAQLFMAQANEGPAVFLEIFDNHSFEVI